MGKDNLEFEGTGQKPEEFRFQRSPDDAALRPPAETPAAAPQTKQKRKSSPRHTMADAHLAIKESMALRKAARKETREARLKAKTDKIAPTPAMQIEKDDVVSAVTDKELQITDDDIIEVSARAETPPGPPGPPIFIKLEPAAIPQAQETQVATPRLETWRISGLPTSADNDNLTLATKKSAFRPAAKAAIIERVKSIWNWAFGRRAKSQMPVADSRSADRDSGHNDNAKSA